MYLFIYLFGGGDTFWRIRPLLRVPWKFDPVTSCLLKSLTKPSCFYSVRFPNEKELISPKFFRVLDTVWNPLLQEIELRFLERPDQLITELSQKIQETFATSSSTNACKIGKTHRQSSAPAIFW